MFVTVFLCDNYMYMHQQFGVNSQCSAFFSLFFFGRFNSKVVASDKIVGNNAERTWKKIAREPGRAPH